MPRKVKAKIKRQPLESYYYKDLGEKERKAADKRLMKTYGIGTEDYDRMFKDQGGRCKICLKIPSTIRFSVDHRHVKGYKDFDQPSKKKEVRGILCFTCNVSLKGIEKTNDGSLNRRRLNGVYKYFQEFKLKGE